MYSLTQRGFDLADEYRMTAMILSDGSLSIFWSNWLVGTICGLAMLMLFWPVLSGLVGRLRPARRATEVSVE